MMMRFNCLWVNLCFQMASHELDSCTENLLPKMLEPREDCTPIAFGKYIFVLAGFEGKPINNCDR